MIFFILNMRQNFVPCGAARKIPLEISGDSMKTNKLNQNRNRQLLYMIM
jgi:hypothetical protein